MPFVFSLCAVSFKYHNKENEPNPFDPISFRPCTSRHASLHGTRAEQLNKTTDLFFPCRLKKICKRKI
ncbi:hypothetical protein L6452_40464 [Arctium lappa]|uniref:Uncharacterized protein n=1 Tax=Arctium lappa TaxID=4217 RepID=A0ACB8XMJ5_ARCLA|nr:hypothetical protein L6452_40464 [Arctium lappa]